MNKTIVIYHRADFDGIFCREIARKFLPHAESIGWDYGDPVPDPTVVSSDDQLYMLDISIEGLMGHPKLIWIDHHKSAMDKFGKLVGYQIDGVAACRLAWQWFDHHAKGLDPHFNQLDPALPGKEEFIFRLVDEPVAVRLAGEYDIWDKRDPNAELFQHGLRSRELSFFDWKELLDDTVPTAIQGTGMEHTGSELICQQLLEAGRSIQYAKTQENDSIIKAYGFTETFEGLTFLCCNHARFNSHLFTGGIKPEHDALLGFNWTGTRFRVSLYHAPGKEHHDLSLIAVKHGGGGHKGACGFQTSALPFLK